MSGSDQRLISAPCSKDTYSPAMATARNYMAWMLSPFQDHIRGDVVEVGFGHGGYADFIKGGRYIGVDIDESSVVGARLRHPGARFEVADIAQEHFLENILPEKADGILCINVLEHLEDDAMVMANLLDALKTGGVLMLSVPAFMGLYGDLDRLAGHYRRYHRRDMARLLAGRPVQVEILRYFNPLGGIGWWVNRFRRHDSLAGEAVNRQIEFFDRHLVPWARGLDVMLRGVFGQSLVCVVRKT